MRRLFNRAMSLMGGNAVEAIKDELTEKRPLPIGLTAFHEWSERIIAGAMLPATMESQKFALANELMHCPPNMAFEADVYFIHRLRKYAVNEVADQVRKDLKADAQRRMEAVKIEEAKQNQAEVTPPAGVQDAEVLEDARV